MCAAYEASAPTLIGTYKVSMFGNYSAGVLFLSFAFNSHCKLWKWSAESWAAHSHYVERLEHGWILRGSNWVLSREKKILLATQSERGGEREAENERTRWTESAWIRFNGEKYFRHCRTGYAARWIRSVGWMRALVMWPIWLRYYFIVMLWRAMDTSNTRNWMKPIYTFGGLRANVHCNISKNHSRTSFGPWKKSMKRFFSVRLRWKHRTAQWQHRIIVLNIFEHF